ncbi:MAG: hypothetical protein QOE83_983 [Actinomycetota bacterium]|nr:hypothetical protein [Actinomycetota bacterium]
MAAQAPPSIRPPHFSSIAQALAYVAKRVDVKVVLPDGLPLSVALSRDTPVYPLLSTTPQGWVLHLTYGVKKHVYIQYGLGIFDGCGSESASDVRVGTMPGALTESHPAGWSELIWPATTTHPVGRYGLAGSFSARQVLRMARSMPVVPETHQVDQGC